MGFGGWALADGLWRMGFGGWALADGLWRIGREEAQGSQEDEGVGVALAGERTESGREGTTDCTEGTDWGRRVGEGAPTCRLGGRGELGRVGLVKAVSCHRSPNAGTVAGLRVGGIWWWGMGSIRCPGERRSGLG